MKHYGLVVRFTAKPGKRDKLLDILLQAADGLRSNGDCLLYLVSKAEKSDDIWIIEVWASKSSHAASLETGQAKALIREAMPLIAGISDRKELIVMGGKGL